jgi:hypothetical protein
MAENPKKKIEIFDNGFFTFVSRVTHPSTAKAGLHVGVAS